MTDVSEVSVQAMEALASGNEVRARIKNLKADLATGKVSILAVLADPPVGLAGRSLFEVALWVPWVGRRRLWALGGLAVRDGINLAVPLDRASVRSREWLAAWMVEREGQWRRWHEQR